MAKVGAKGAISGIMAIYKPRGATCATVLNQIKKTMLPSGTERKYVKMGHGGTLDKNAEGILVVGVGPYTKHLSKFLKCDKQYKASGVLGIATDTLDATGQVTMTKPWEHVTLEQIDAALENFRGTTMQQIPLYSAKKVNGTRLSDMARQGEIIDPPYKQVVAKAIALDRRSTLPDFRLELTCSGGFYVRSLISDVGIAVGSCAHMTHLVRTAQGPFKLDRAVVLQQSDWSAVSLMEALEQGTRQYNSAKDMLR